MRQQIIETVISVIFDRYNIQNLETFFGTKSKEFVELRDVFCYSCLNLGVPNVVISDYLKGRGVNGSHANISRGNSRIKQKIKSDEILNSEISFIIAECSQRMKYGKGQ
jgi:chromosomal replication initiation ATPase DnaA